MKHTVLAIGQCYFCCWRDLFGLQTLTFSWIHHCIHSLKNYSRTYLMPNFVLSLMSSASSVTSIFLQLLYHSKWSCTFPGISVSASIFCYCTMVNMTDKRRHYNFISYPCTIPCIYKKDTNLYIITMLSYFLLWSKKGHKQQWWTYWTCTFWLRLDISSLSICASSICLSLLFVSYFWSNYDVPRTKEFFVLFRGELLRVKRQWPSDSKVNVVKCIFKCTIILVWLCLDQILLWPAWLAFISVGHQSWHHINPIFFSVFQGGFIQDY